MILFTRFLIAASLLIGQLWGGPTLIAAADTVPVASSLEIQESLRKRIEAEKGNHQFICRGEVECPPLFILRFYERRNFQPAWSINGQISPYTDDLVTVLSNVATEGLRPADYHLYTIKFLLNRFTQLQDEGKKLSLEELVDLDFLLTDAFLLYGSHLLNGRVNPEDINEQWVSYDHASDLAVILDEAISSQTMQSTLDGLRSSHDGYLKMIKALANFRSIAKKGGWPVIGAGFNLRKGVHHRRVYALRERLVISGDYESTGINDGNYFDEKLADAVHLFQQRHGLDMDGIVGPATLAALNVPVERRIRQIELNMERWRWISHNLGQRYILVNIADFNLKVIEDSKERLEMRVVVGKPHRSTPIFSDMVEYLVVNPYWYLPKTIVVEDVVPSVLADPDYLIKKEIKVFAAGSNETHEVESTEIDWTMINTNNLPYKLRQEPGLHNALGRVKIMFPNRFSVYLHDTPRQELFRKTARDFSSGCIRLEKPVELVAYLLGNDPKWSLENITNNMESGERQVISLSEQIPIHILYWTAWVGEDGKINFRKDIYNRDEMLVAALDGIAPQP